jgi:hypothetical protein
MVVIAQEGEKMDLSAVKALGAAQDTEGNLVPLRAGPQEEPGMEGAAGDLDQAAAFG